MSKKDQKETRAIEEQLASGTKKAQKDREKQIYQEELARCKEADQKRKTRLIRWDKLDNTAHLFPVIAGESMSNVYRISVILKEEVQRDILQEALNLVLPKFDGFNLRLRTGLFWYYFEENGKLAPRVKEEKQFPCRFIEQSRNHSYLFRVTYCGCRINLEVFHVLTDGMGGLNFLRELTYQYLRLAHKELRELHGDTLSQDTSLNREDSFVKNFRKKAKNSYQSKRAFLIRQETLPKGEFGVISGLMPVEQLKEAAHKYDASINEYLVANFVYSTYQVYLHKMSKDVPIRVAVPVNLRPFFDSVTTKNFFIMVSAEFYPDREDYTFQEILQKVKESLHSQISKEHLEQIFSYSVGGQTNLFARAVPLGIKNAYMKAIYKKSAMANTTTVTNIGNIQVDEAYRPYVESFRAFIAMSQGQSLKGTICSYGGKLVFTFSSIFQENSIQRKFFKHMAEEGIDVQIETNGVYYE